MSTDPWIPWHILSMIQPSRKQSIQNKAPMPRSMKGWEQKGRQNRGSKSQIGFSWFKINKFLKFDEKGIRAPLTNTIPPSPNSKALGQIHQTSVTENDHSTYPGLEYILERWSINRSTLQPMSSTTHSHTTRIFKVRGQKTAEARTIVGWQSESFKGGHNYLLYYFGLFVSRPEHWIFRNFQTKWGSNTTHNIDSCSKRTSSATPFLCSIDRWYLCCDIAVEKLTLSPLARLTTVPKMSSAWHNNKCFSLLWASSSGMNLLLSSLTVLRLASIFTGYRRSYIFESYS